MSALLNAPLPGPGMQVPLPAFEHVPVQPPALQPQDAIQQPVDGLDLSMELSRIVDMVDFETQCETRVASYEQQLQSRAADEVRTAVAAHEQALTDGAASQLAHAQLEIQAAMANQQAFQGQMVQQAQAITSHHEGLFVAGARNELQQYETFVLRQCASHEEEAMRNGVAHLQAYFEGIFEQRVQEMQLEYESQQRTLAEHMRSEAHAELLRAESHIAGEHRAITARHALTSEELIAARR